MRLLQLLQLNVNVLITEILQTIKNVILKKIYSSIGVFTVTSVTLKFYRDQFSIF